MDDVLALQLEYPDGFLAASALEVVAFVVVALVCLVRIRSGMAAAFGSVGGLLAGGSSATYLADTLLIMYGSHDADELGGFLIDASELTLTLLLWTRAIGIALIAIAVVLALRQGTKSRTR